MSRLYHCTRIVREHWLAIPCDRPAIVVYELPDGSKAGWCVDHRAEGDKHALARGWRRLEPTLEAASFELPDRKRLVYAEQLEDLFSHFDIPARVSDASIEISE